jgi:hypothetical protein
MEDVMAEYREVVIQWQDDPEPDKHIVTVVVGRDWNNGDEDDDIFFYFQNEAEFEQARSGEGYEFKIVEWFEEDN